MNRISALCLALLISPAAQSLNSKVVLPKTVTPLDYKIFVSPDAHKMTFDGDITITIKVKNPTRTIVLNAADLALKQAHIDKIGDAQIAYDSKLQTATMTFAQTLRPGEYRLAISYNGVIYKNASGLFALENALYTQFESADARRFIPCFDEPGLKATFELTARVPESLTALSNTQVAESKPDANHMKIVRFERTPKMSTYLLFFGLGDFERTSRMVNGVEIAVVVKKGNVSKAAYALETASKLLPFYEDYFGVKYPLLKLDLIALPGTSQSFSAMENWGAITYFDRAILVDPAITTETNRRTIFNTIAHEMAHQWFGDLVTMAWWDDLWLNEGFATWMANNATAHFHPEWKPWLDAINDIEEGMQLDVKTGTHPVVQTILDVFQADQAFDKITYDKASAVIRMIENHIGESNFCAGIRAYMHKFGYKNTVSDDLWREIDLAARKPISTIAHDFTRKTGVPLVEVSKTPSGWKLDQRVFSVDGSTPSTQQWKLPIDVTRVGEQKSEKSILTGARPMEISDPAHMGVYLNANLSGYYRVHYDDAAFAQLLAAFDALPAPAQTSLIEDSRELGFAGVVQMSRFLSLAKRAGPSTNPFVLSRILNSLEYLNTLHRGLKTQTEFANFVTKIAHPIIERIGWTAQDTDAPNTSVLRAQTIKLLSEVKDESTLTKAADYFDRFLKDQKSLTSELRTSVLTANAINADAKRFKQIHEFALQTSKIIEQEQYYSLLAANRDQALAQKAMLIALDKTTPSTIGPEIIQAVAARFPVLAFDFALQHYGWLKERLEPSVEPRFVAQIISNSFERKLIPELENFAKTHIASSAMQNVEKAKASITFNADIREKRIPEVDEWLLNASF